MLRCPYRKMTTAYEHEGLIQSEETFCECHKDTCPLYVKGRCVRVQQEIRDAMSYYPQVPGVTPCVVPDYKGGWRLVE